MFFVEIAIMKESLFLFPPLLPHKLYYVCKIRVCYCLPSLPFSCFLLSVPISNLTSISKSTFRFPVLTLPPSLLLLILFQYTVLFTLFCLSAPSRLSMEVPSPRCLREELVWLQQSLSVLGSPVVLCHNDLLCKNIIYNEEEGEY